jgi:putative membrane protein
MTIAATVVALLAAILHVGIFVMESVGWTRPTVWRRFNLHDQQQADATRDLAFNQGFYNLFLAVAAIVGVVLVWVGVAPVGWTLVITAVATMLAAAVVLSTLGREFLRPAATQGVIPLIALVLSIVAIV